VELLTVVVIISLLAGMSMLALTSTMTAAKESKTRGTIAKLDAAILDIYESYQERFDSILDQSNYSSFTGTLTNQQLGKLKLHLMYDLMRLEMPSYWNEISTLVGSPPTVIPPIPITSADLGNATSYSFVLLNTPPVCNYYISEAVRIKAVGGSFNNGPAEMLFLIIANLNPEALENFQGSEIGDTNNNGAREFLDAWGNPIYFLRFAPGFTGSDLQPDIVRLANLSLVTGMYPGNTTLWTPLPTSAWDTTTDLGNAYAQAISQSSDPFDSNDEVRQSWFLYPLIISAGADGLFDLDLGRRTNFSATTIGELAFPTTDFRNINPFNHPSGIPWDETNSGTFHHYDNIHNHRSSNSF
jgi:type II secretory pathway pseudopilin PulG